MIKDTSKYGTVVSYEESEHQGNSGGWDSLRHYIPPSRRGQSPASGVEELARFSEEIRSLARPLGTDIDGNRFAQQQLSKGIKGRDKVSTKGFYSSMNSLQGLATGRSNIKNIIDEYAPYDVETDFEGFKRTINEVRRNHQLRCQLLEFFGKNLKLYGNYRHIACQSGFITMILVI